MSLPTLLVFSLKVAEHEVRYLSFTGPHRQLRFGFDEGVYSDNARFTVEQAGNGLVHIRSCYENYYWSRASRFEPWLLASAPETVEDMTNDMCTLFRLRMSAGNVSGGFVHVQSGLNVVMRPATDAHAYNLCVEWAPSTEFSFIDYAPLSEKKLPRYIMFIGDNDKYLNTFVDEDSTLARHHFRGVSNPTDKTVGFEVMYTKSGDVRIKSILHPQFWRGFWFRHVGMSLDDESDNPNDPYTIFEVVLSSFPRGMGIALRCLGWDQFCARDHSTDLFFVGAQIPIGIGAWIRPIHAAHEDRRRVNIESFRHAWAAPRTSRFLTEWVFTNITDRDRRYNFAVRYWEHNTTKFSSSISQFRGPPVVFNCRLPFVTSSGNLEFSDVNTDTPSFWGLDKVDTVWQSPVTSTTLPAKTKAIVTVVINMATYEVPFSYKQLDEFPFGGNVTQHLHDGVFTVKYEYGFGVKPVFQPLTKSEFNEILGVEVEGEPGFFVYEVPRTQDSVNEDEFDQVQGSGAPDEPSLDSLAPVSVTQDNPISDSSTPGSEARDGSRPDSSTPEADATGGI